MRFAVTIDTRAAKEIAALPKSDRIRAIAKIEALASNPRPQGCVKLAGKSGLWRIRTGTNRIIYQIQDSKLVVIVVKVGHRRAVYREK